MIAADARQLFDLGKGFCEDRVLALAHSFPAVLRQGHDARKALGAAHHQKVEDVVAHNNALRVVFDLDGAVFDVGDREGLGRAGGKARAEHDKGKKARNKSGHNETVRVSGRP